MDPLTRRLLKELREVKQLEKNGDGGEGVVELGPVAEEDLTEWRCVLQGPSGSPYEGGTFTLKIQVPPTYPLQPPTITFKTRVCHPNVHLKTGEICLDVLKNAWTPAWSLHSACMAVGVLLTSPEADSPLNCDAANLLRAGDERGYNSLVRMHVRLHAAKK
ncbi:ubiquitin-conjugating enzyme/RWD-like protein [Cladochytrium replicatum]|nr:ubiquitin-conjugating enzyme/RWD-like protein [Cladochytrium replicatum]